MAAPETRHGDRSSMEKTDIERIEQVSDAPTATNQPLQNEDGETVTIILKTWFVIFTLSSTFGLSFWPVPTTAARFPDCECLVCTSLYHCKRHWILTGRRKFRSFSVVGCSCYSETRAAALDSL
jgi:hypothetical protein